MFLLSRLVTVLVTEDFLDTEKGTILRTRINDFHSKRYFSEYIYIYLSDFIDLLIRNGGGECVNERDD